MPGTPRVLVVEDDPDIGTNLCELLRGEGYEVELVENGAAAIERLDAIEPPCVVLVDLLMPGLRPLIEFVREGCAGG